MADVVVTHKFVSGKADGPDPTLVQPSKWNQDHNFGAGVDGQVLVRDSAQTDGANWLDLPSVSGGAYAVRGLVGQNQAAAPNMKYEISADAVVLRNPTTGQTITKTATGTLTNDTGVAGVTANGRDQAGAFGSSIWIHFYFIVKADGTGLASLSSIVAPPTGPTLPATYTHWAYAGAVFYNASPLLVKTRMRGAWMWYEAQQSALSGGTATTETSVSLTALVPPNARDLHLTVNNNVTADAGGVLDFITKLRIVAGSDYLALRVAFSGLTNAGQFPQSFTAPIPNIGQSFLYLTTVTTGSAPALTITLLGYSVPNGGE